MPKCSSEFGLAMTDKPNGQAATIGFITSLLIHKKSKLAHRTKNQRDYLTVTVPNSFTTPPQGEKPPVVELPYETMPVMTGPVPL
jgi:hypothetical protein